MRTRLYVLDFGLFQVREGGRVIGIPGYLIVVDQKRAILVDTGFPARYVEDARGVADAEGLSEFGSFVELGPKNLPAAQLALAGVTPEQVTDIVLTHSHIDHVGGLELFPKATVVVGAAERALPRPLYWRESQPLEWPEVAYRTVERDTRIAPGVTVLHTPGHTPGHLAVMVRLPKTGPLILTADAISRPDELEQDTFADAWDPARARASAHRIMAMAADTGASIIFGHDPAQWPRLRKAPEFYA